MKAWLQKVVSVFVGGAVGAIMQLGVAHFSAHGFTRQSLYSCALAAVAGGGTALYYFLKNPPFDFDSDGDGIPDWMEPGKGRRATDPKPGDPPITATTAQK